MKKLLLCFMVLVLWACESDDDTNTPTGGTPAGAEGGTPAGAEGGTPAGAEGGTPAGAEGGTPAGMTGGATGGTQVTCTPKDVDYPIASNWDACTSDDDGKFNFIVGQPAAAARAQAFEQIGDLLWRNAEIAQTSFVDAELIYGEDEGIHSRVVRRYDAHVAKPEGADCELPDAGTQWPDYCVSPALIMPLVDKAFADGSAGVDMKINAQRIQAGLLWFFYLSVYKEAYSCYDTPEDCDASLGYDNGAKQLDEDGIGFGGFIQEIDENAYKALFNAHLAVRCWREADPAEISENPELHRVVLDQLDRALDHAFSLFLIDRLEKFKNATADQKTELWAFMEIIGPVIQNAAERKDSMAASELAAGWAEGAMIDVDAQKTRLANLFPCPY